MEQPELAASRRRLRVPASGRPPCCPDRGEKLAAPRTGSQAQTTALDPVAARSQKKGSGAITAGLTVSHSSRDLITLADKTGSKI